MARTFYQVKPMAPQAPPEEPAAPSPAQLVDDMGKLHAQIATLTAHYNAKRDALEAMGEGRNGKVEGTQYEARRSAFSQSKLDTNAIRAAMDQKWIGRYSYDVPVVKWEVKPRDPNKGAAP